MSKMRIVELFAGIGAWSKALVKLGIEHEIVEAIEFDEKTMQSYNTIHGTNFKSKDITKLNGDDVPDCDVIFYSPPCQAFSIAGRQEGFEDRRGTLFFDALRIIQAKKPKYAIMENVKGLTQKKFQFEFETMLQLLEQEGYKNYWKVLNAKDYGIPQNRERVFIVSIRNDMEQDFEFPQPFDNGLRLKHLLEDGVDEKYYIDEEKTKKLLEELRNEEYKKGILIDDTQGFDGVRIYDNTSPSLRSQRNGLKTLEIRPCLTPERVNKRQNGRRFKEDDEPSFTVTTQDRNGILQIGLLEIKGNEQIRRVYDPDGIAPTLNTMQGGNRQPKILQLGYRIRKLTPLECLRLMGFSDEDYAKLKNKNISNSQIYKMSGNSIVVDTISAMLGKLFAVKQKELINT